jgi:uroporphyrinogen-III synthase
MTPHPIAGRRVLVTRSARDAGRWATRLAALGAEPVILPCLTSEPIADGATGRALLDALDSAAWLVVTSVKGCEAAAALLGDVTLPAGVRVAAVGPVTAAAATAHLGRIDLVPRAGTASGLARTLLRLLRREGTMETAQVVVLAAEGGRQDVVTLLQAAGVQVTRILVYRTIPATATAAKRDLAAEGIDFVLLASPSAVTGLLGRAVLPQSVRVITIGPTTSAAAIAAGLAITAEAARPTLDGILEAIQ